MLVRPVLVQPVLVQPVLVQPVLVQPALVQPALVQPVLEITLMYFLRTRSDVKSLFSMLEHLCLVVGLGA